MGDRKGEFIPTSGYTWCSAIIRQLVVFHPQHLSQSRRVSHIHYCFSTTRKMGYYGAFHSDVILWYPRGYYDTLSCDYCRCVNYQIVQEGLISNVRDSSPQRLMRLLLLSTELEA